MKELQIEAHDGVGVRKIKSEGVEGETTRCSSATEFDEEYYAENPVISGLSGKRQSLL